MPTFGNTSTTEQDTWALWDGYAQGTKFTLSEAGTLTSASVYGHCAATGQSQKLRICIYADNAGALGALKDVTAEIVGDYNGGASKWWTGNFTGASLAAGTYWMVVWGGTVTGGGFYLTLQTSGGNGAHLAESWATYSSTGSPPDPGGAITEIAAGYNISLYATYSTSPDAPTITAEQSGSNILIGWS